MNERRTTDRNDEEERKNLGLAPDDTDKISRGVASLSGSQVFSFFFFSLFVLSV
jgi:hypothetical protein